MINLKNENFNELTQEGTVLVDFFATWCGPCQMLGPVIEEIEKENKALKIVKVDVDEHEDLARSFGIMSVPTLQLYKDGKCIKTQTGFVPKEHLVSWLNEEEGIN